MFTQQKSQVGTKQLKHPRHTNCLWKNHFSCTHGKVAVQRQAQIEKWRCESAENGKEERVDYKKDVVADVCRRYSIHYTIHYQQVLYSSHPNYYVQIYPSPGGQAHRTGVTVTQFNSTMPWHSGH